MDSSIQKFQFQTKLFAQVKTLPLSDIKDSIAENARKRLLNNWWFTNRKIHNATISAINFYNTLSIPEQEKHHETMQDILTSHTRYLYSPVYWNKKKHLLLIDLFMNQVANKRLDVTLLDVDHELGFGTGMLTGFIVSKNKHEKK